MSQLLGAKRGERRHCWARVALCSVVRLGLALEHPTQDREVESRWEFQEQQWLATALCSSARCPQLVLDRRRAALRGLAQLPRWLGVRAGLPRGLRFAPPGFRVSSRPVA